MESIQRILEIQKELEQVLEKLQTNSATPEEIEQLTDYINSIVEESLPTQLEQTEKEILENQNEEINFKEEKE